MLIISNNKYQKSLTIILLIVLSHIAVKAQSIQLDFDNIDIFATSVPDTFSNHHKLAEHLTQNYSDDLSKARSIFYWIIDNIKYDEELAFVKKKAYDFEYEPKYFFESKSATCIGYSRLFAKMCQTAGITSFPINGYIKWIYTIENVYLHTMHVWNVIQINNNWYHIDLTFDGHKHQNDNDSLDFLMNISELSEDRLPANPMWQFRQKPISFEDFDPECTQSNQIIFNNWNWQDSIDNYVKMKEVDRKLYDAWHAVQYNPYTCIDYGIILIQKGDTVSYEDFETAQDYIKNDQISREFYYEALKHLNPNIPVYLEDDDIVFYRAKRVKEYRKEAEKKIKYYENKYAIFYHYID